MGEGILIFVVGLVTGALLLKFISSSVVGAPLFNMGEINVSQRLRKSLKRPDFFIIDNVTLNIGANSTTQIDHIVVSRFGIFVIETKQYSGWIYGDEDSARWTQVFYKKKFSFHNPVIQNVGHLRALRALFTLDEDHFHSLVVFAGNKAEFKTPMPSEVMRDHQMIREIKSHDEEVLTHKQVVYVVGRIETERLDRSSETDEYHRNNIKRRFGDK